MKKVAAGEALLKDAIEMYDAEVFERGRHEIELSSKQGYADHHFDAWGQSTTAQSGITKLRAENTAVETKARLH